MRFGVGKAFSVDRKCEVIKVSQSVYVSFQLEI